MSEETPPSSPLRVPTGSAAIAVGAWCFALSVLHLVNAIWPFLSDFDRNVMHFSGFAVLAGALYPIAKGDWARSRFMVYVDVSLGVIALLASFWFVITRGPCVWEL